MFHNRICLDYFMIWLRWTFRREYVHREMVTDLLALNSLVRKPSALALYANLHAPSTWEHKGAFPGWCHLAARDSESRQDNDNRLLFRASKNWGRRRYMKHSKPLQVRPQTHTTSFCTSGWCIINASSMSLSIVCVAGAWAVAAAITVGLQIKRTDSSMAPFAFCHVAIRMKMQETLLSHPSLEDRLRS